MKPLYTTSTGFEVNSHSYSAGQTLQYCPRRYKLERIDGWKTRETPAVIEFGKALEKAIESYYTTWHRQPGSCVKEFEILWSAAPTDLSYSADDGDHERMAIMGRDMSKLVELRSDELGLSLAAFQTKVEKVLPSGHKIIGYLDLIVPGELVLDIKTSSLAAPFQNFVQMDEQLRIYSALTGVPRVGFWWFQRVNPTLKKGNMVTSLVPLGGLPADTEFEVISIDPEENKVFLLEDPRQYEHLFPELRKKADKENAKAWLNENAVVLSIRENGDVPEVTKQRMNVPTTYLTSEQIQNALQNATNQISLIQKYQEQGFWPQTPGIRFPNNRCSICPMLPICTGNKNEIVTNLVNKHQTNDDDDFLIELIGDNE